MFGRDTCLFCSCSFKCSQVHYCIFFPTNSLPSCEIISTSSKNPQILRTTCCDVLLLWKSSSHLKLWWMKRMKPGLWAVRGGEHKFTGRRPTFRRLIRILAAHGAKVPIFCDILAWWVTGEWHVPELMRFIQKGQSSDQKGISSTFTLTEQQALPTGHTTSSDCVGNFHCYGTNLVSCAANMTRGWEETQPRVHLVTVTTGQLTQTSTDESRWKLIREDRWAGRVWQKSQRDLMFSLVLSSHSAGLDFSVRAADFYFEISRAWISWFSC